MKKLLLLAIIFFIVLNIGRSQTYVKGGIYSNTTWTKANSPYIVTDTMAVFPGVTLTIEPGVEVRCRKSVMIEIRQAQIIAVGTPTDSITFTSDSSNPYPGVYIGIWMNTDQNSTSKFSYCNFKYSSRALDIERNYPTNDSTLVNNCSFNSNFYGVYYYLSDNLIFTNSTFKNNYYAFTAYAGGAESIWILNSEIINNRNGLYNIFNAHIENSVIDFNTNLGIECEEWDTIKYCEINYNGIGISNYYDLYTEISNNFIEQDTVGILLGSNNDSIFCNSICNCIKYNVQNTLSYTSNSYLTDNYWCTNDSIKIDSSIYDGYDNISLGLVFFKPFHEQPCDSVGTVTGINQTVSNSASVKVFPNPSNGIFTIEEQGLNSKGHIEIYNMLGEQVYSQFSTFNSPLLIDLSNNPSGIYLYRVLTETGELISNGKFVIQK